jgi:pimeloyl-ACP methyl ester carboxylesterase
MPFAVNDGVRIHYEVEGEGPPLVLYHGLAMSLEVWRIWGFVEGLKDNYKLILIDARGHGYSDKPYDPEAYRIEPIVTDVVNVLDDLNIEKTHFLGYSMGGQIGWSIGKYAPDRFSSLIIGGMSPYEKEPDVLDPVGEYYLSIIRQGNEAIIAFFEENTPHMVTPEFKAVLMNNDPEALIAWLLRKDRVDYKETLATTNLPCLLYMGEADSDYAEAKERSDLLTNLKFVALPNLDHVECHMRSELVLPHILQFLANMTKK